MVTLLTNIQRIAEMIEGSIIILKAIVMGLVVWLFARAFFAALYHLFR